jgi:hypothetical protein
MVSRPVPTQYLTAGQEYLDALRTLGLTPNFLGWGWDIAAEQWLLVLVTPIVDTGGPLALNKLLFRAYNANATPQQISPFIVRVFSPDIIPSDFWILGDKMASISAVKGKQDWTPVKIDNVQKTFLGLELEMINSYQTLKPPKRRGYIERRKEWDKFKGNVDKLAA